MTGHKDHRTAQGYAHAKSRGGDAARLSERFASKVFGADLATPALNSAAAADASEGARA